MSVKYHLLIVWLKHLIETFSFSLIAWLIYYVLLAWLIYYVLLAWLICYILLAWG